MSNEPQAKSKITFGNILLTLLVIGTFVVIGLMYVLYREISKPTVIDTETRQQPAASRPVEALSPDGKPVSPTPVRDASLPTVGAPDPREVPGVASEPDDAFDRAALNTGAAPAKKAKKVEKEKEKEKEIPLVPIAGGGDSGGEVSLRPVETAPAPKKTPRPAQQNTPKKSTGGDAIDELF